MALALGILLVIGYWSFYPYKPLTINTPEASVENKKLKVGEFLHYKIDYCKNYDISARLDRAFIDGVIYSMPSTNANNPIGCAINNIYMEVPNLPTGTYKLKIEYRYEVNPIRTVYYQVYTEDFQIVK